MTPEQIEEALLEVRRTGHITNAPAGDPMVARAAEALRYTLNVQADGSGADMGRHQAEQAPELILTAGKGPAKPPRRRK